MHPSNTLNLPLLLAHHVVDPPCLLPIPMFPENAGTSPSTGHELSKKQAEILAPNTRRHMNHQKSTIPGLDFLSSQAHRPLSPSSRTLRNHFKH